MVWYILNTFIFKWKIKDTKKKMLKPKYLELERISVTKNYVWTFFKAKKDSNASYNFETFSENIFPIGRKMFNWVSQFPHNFILYILQNYSPLFPHFSQKHTSFSSDPTECDIWFDFCLYFILLLLFLISIRL